MKVDYVTSPDFSRGVITVERLVPKKNKNRVMKVVGVHSTPVLTRNSRQINRLIKLYG